MKSSSSEVSTQNFQPEQISATSCLISRQEFAQQRVGGKSVASIRNDPRNDAPGVVPRAELIQVRTNEVYYAANTRVRYAAWLGVTSGMWLPRSRRAASPFSGAGSGPRLCLLGSHPGDATGLLGGRSRWFTHLHAWQSPLPLWCALGAARLFAPRNAATGEYLAAELSNSYRAAAARDNPTGHGAAKTSGTERFQRWSKTVASFDG